MGKTVLPFFVLVEFWAGDREEPPPSIVPYRAPFFAKIPCG
jgi:hypothetical protein